MRLEGTNVDLGKKILADSGLPIISGGNMADAARKVVAAARGGPRKAKGKAETKPKTRAKPKARGRGAAKTKPKAKKKAMKKAMEDRSRQNSHGCK